MSERLNFKNWLMENSLRDILSGVPQDPGHHPEGDVFTHTRMVRQQLDKAIAVLKSAQQRPDNPFQNLDFDLDKEERQILRVAAWMHDIGKKTATTLNVDGQHTPWQDAGDPSQGRWQALGHETPFHYKPQMRKLGAIWQSIWRNTDPEAKKDVLFIINHHMGLRGSKQAGVSRKTLNKWIGKDGQYQNRRRLKLLLVFIVMDQTGRDLPDLDAVAGRATAGMQGIASDVQKRQNRASKQPASDDPIEFLSMFVGKRDRQGNPFDRETISRMFTGKFGRIPTDDEYNAVFSA